MKKIYIIIMLALVAVLACVPEEDIRVTTTGPEPVTLSSSGDVVLNKGNNPNLALTVNWTDNSNIGTTGAGSAARNVTVNYVQFSGTEDFEKFVESQASSGSSSLQFTVEALNKLMIKLGLPGGVASTVYIRLASKLGVNMSPVYSNVISLKVTPYAVDLSLGHVLDKDQSDSGKTLPRTADGVYSGFLGVASWYNWWLQEGDGTIWGNVGASGKTFFISSASDSWNMWFPAPAGSYYVIVDTGNGEWSAMHLPEISVSGDISGTMSFDRDSNTWKLAYDASSTGSISVSLSGTGKQYNTTTTDSSSEDAAFGFGGSADAVTFSGEASAISVPVTETGEQFLLLNLDKMTLSLGAGGSETPSISPVLYMAGINDGWTNAGGDFDRFLRLYDESTVSYAGVYNVNSKWGYRLYPEKEGWDNYYTFAEGDAASGKLSKGGDGNIPAPETGLYLIKASLGNLTYSLTSVSKVQITGFNDQWVLLDMTAGDTEGVYTIEVNLTAKTSWGFKVYFDNDWTNFFGGADGILVYGEKDVVETPGAPVDDGLVGGTHTVTVDLYNGTYTIE